MYLHAYHVYTYIVRESIDGSFLSDAVYMYTHAYTYTRCESLTRLRIFFLSSVILQEIPVNLH